MPVWAVPALRTRYLLRCQSEEETVFLAGLCGSCSGWSFARADRKRPVRHEFHVARSACFITRGRDLVGNIARGNRAFGQRGAVIGQECHLEPAARYRVIVDRASEVI